MDMNSIIPAKSQKKKPAFSSDLCKDRIQPI